MTSPPTTCAGGPREEEAPGEGAEAGDDVQRGVTPGGTRLEPKRVGAAGRRHSATQQPSTHLGGMRSPGHAPLIGFPQGGVRYSARPAATFASGKRMQFPSEEMTVHSSSEWHARSACGTFAQRVSSASHLALPVPWAQRTRSIRSPGFRSHTAGGSGVLRTVDISGAAGGDGACAATGVALSGGAAGGKGTDSTGGGLEATTGGVAAGGTFAGGAPSQAASAMTTSQRYRVTGATAPKNESVFGGSGWLTFTPPGG